SVRRLSVERQRWSPQRIQDGSAVRVHGHGTGRAAGNDSGSVGGYDRKVGQMELHDVSVRLIVEGFAMSLGAVLVGLGLGYRATGTCANDTRLHTPRSFRQPARALIEHGGAARRGDARPRVGNGDPLFRSCRTAALQS